MTFRILITLESLIALVVLVAGNAPWQVTALMVGLLTIVAAVLERWQARRATVTAARGSPSGPASASPHPPTGPDRAEHLQSQSSPGDDADSGDEMDPSTHRPQLTKEERQRIEDLFRQKSPSLFRCALRMTGSRADAEDLVQTTFHEVVRSWANIRGYEDELLTKWLYRVLRNKTGDLWRKSGREFPLTEPPPSPHQPDAVAADVEVRWAITVCREEISRMPLKRRQVAHLIWFESWTYAEVADHLQIAPSTARGHLHEARKRLKDILGQLDWLIDEDAEGKEPE